MLKRLLPVVLAITVLLTACGPQGTPTMTSAEVEGTAVSSAWTMVALTQQAIPTATPIPPSETPTATLPPTETPLASPTPDQLFLPTATQAALGDCMGPLNMGEAGPTVPVRIENHSGGKIVWISFNLSTNAFGQCGALSYNNILNNDTLTIRLPRGSYYVGAGIELKKGSSSYSQGNFQLTIGMDDLVSLVVKENSIVLKL
ncbi:MAG: hypothetical protein K8S20_16970 [Chloroflexi bacterium]|nr:hypothetical protein [Chloroflexota bacterium]